MYYDTNMSQQLVLINGSVQWRAFRDASTRQWIGVCAPLKLTARGADWVDLCADINDIIQTLFGDLVSQGKPVFESFLKQHGWSPITPIPINAADVRFDIPMPIEHVAHA